ncbi:MAG: hypothetical protein A2068_07315 [Ignavibacteria bacterium GWB2_35_6b]|nr:MAG: hypothetical protein A2068_07315 [Ignavibacteria bacterium GWB2_35_6b]
MIIAKAEKHLKKHIHNQYIYRYEVHDKYLLTRKIGKLFPEIPNNLIVKSVDKCINLISSPITKDDFVRLFLDQLFLIVDNELES